MLKKVKSLKNILSGKFTCFFSPKFHEKLYAKNGQICHINIEFVFSLKRLGLLTPTHPQFSVRVAGEVPTMESPCSTSNPSSQRSDDELEVDESNGVPYVVKVFGGAL